MKLATNLLILIILFVLVAPFSNGMLVSPGTYHLNYQLGQEQIIIFTVSNQDDLVDYRLIVNLSGSLAPYAILDTKEIYLKGGETNSAAVQARLTLPENLTPGAHSLGVLFLQKPEKKYGQSSSMAVAIALMPQAKVYIPYPNKYAEIKLGFEAPDLRTKIGETVYMNALFYNRGSEVIEKAKGNIEIYEKKGEEKRKLTTVPLTELANIAPSDNPGKMLAELEPVKENMNAGAYSAIAVVDYDGSLTKSVEYNFWIGDIQLEASHPDRIEFPADSISKLRFNITSRWNEPLSFYGRLEAKDKDGKLLKEAISQTFPIMPWATIEAELLVDFIGLTAGYYPMTLKLYYSGRETNSSFLGVLTKKAEEKKEVPEPEKGKGIGGKIIKPALIILVLLLLIAYIIRRRIQSRGDYEA